MEVHLNQPCNVEEISISVLTLENWGRYKEVQQLDILSKSEENSANLWHWHKHWEENQDIFGKERGKVHPWWLEASPVQSANALTLTLQLGKIPTHLWQQNNKKLRSMPSVRVNIIMKTTIFHISEVWKSSISTATLTIKSETLKAKDWNG